MLKTIKSKRKKSVIAQRKSNGKTSFENLNFPSLKEVKTDIDKKIGKRPSLPKDLPGGVWSEQAIKVIQERYLVRDSQGKIIETPEEMCWRVSWEIASAEARWGKGRREVADLAKEFYKLLVRREFLPNSPTLMNAGTGNNLQYSACFVLPVEDSMEGIFDALKYQALIHKSGGGTGFAFSRLRPNGSMVKSSTGTASGPVSFMRVFDAATNEVKQGGKRRGANMGILRVDHPDILDFIRCKEEGGITNFNISVAISDKFMEAYENNKDYDLIDPKTKKNPGSLSARMVFEEISKSAWRTGDPGLVFIDRRNRNSSNPVPALGPIEATNPCGEQELYPYDACNLGSIFLTYFIKEINGKNYVDWEKLKEVVRIATRFLDNVIEVNPYPLEQIRKTVLAIRRIGLGIGGWADMLIDLKIPYDSDEALQLAEKIMGVIQEEAVATTRQLAKERGPFPLWPISIYKNEEPRRNSTVTTIAPTGSISIIAGSSSGIEPLFAIAFQHIVKDKHLSRTLAFFNPKFEEIAKSEGFWTGGVKEKVAKQGTIRDISEVPQHIRDVFGTAHEIHHDWHIKMQAVFQKHTENAVSKTINLRNEASEDEVKEAYLLAWKTGCKGITVFRDGCKDVQVLNLGIKKDTSKDFLAKEPTLIRPYRVSGATYKVNTPVGTAFVTINEDADGEPLEVFVNVGKAGSDITAIAEALGRTISTALRFRGNLSPRSRAQEIAMQLAGIGGRRSVGFGPNKIRSLPDAIAVAISNHFQFKINGNLNQVNNSHNSYDTSIDGKTDGQTYFRSNGKAGAGLVADGSALAESIQASRLTADPTLASALHKNVGKEASGLVYPSKKVTDVNLGMNANIENAASVSSVELHFDSSRTAGDICPSCGASALVYEEGCSKCHVCGHSEC